MRRVDEAHIASERSARKGVRAVRRVDEAHPGSERSHREDVGLSGRVDDVRTSRTQWPSRMTHVPFVTAEACTLRGWPPEQLCLFCLFVFRVVCCFFVVCL